MCLGQIIIVVPTFQNKNPTNSLLPGLCRLVCFPGYVRNVAP